MPLNFRDGVMGKGQLFQMKRVHCDWIMTSPGKQAFVGKRVATSLETTAGEGGYRKKYVDILVGFSKLRQKTKQGNNNPKYLLNWHLIISKTNIYQLRLL